MESLETMKDNQELLNAKEVRALLKISVSALWTYVNDGTIKSYKIGKHAIRFKKNEVLETLKPNVR